MAASNSVVFCLVTFSLISVPSTRTASSTTEKDYDQNDILALTNSSNNSLAYGAYLLSTEAEDSTLSFAANTTLSSRDGGKLTDKKFVTTAKSNGTDVSDDYVKTSSVSVSDATTVSGDFSSETVPTTTVAASAKDAGFFTTRNIVIIVLSIVVALIILAILLSVCCRRNNDRKKPPPKKSVYSCTCPMDKHEEKCSKEEALSPSPGIEPRKKQVDKSEWVGSVDSKKEPDPAASLNIGPSKVPPKEMSFAEQRKIYKRLCNEFDPAPDTSGSTSS